MCFQFTSAESVGALSSALMTRSCFYEIRAVRALVASAALRVIAEQLTEMAAAGELVRRGGSEVWVIDILVPVCVVKSLI